jgi:anaphase-promoting complex subunit 4
LLSASLSPPSQDRSRSNHSDPATDDTDDANLNSILAVSDDLGYIYFFLDGSYSLGAFLIGPKVSTSTLFKMPAHSTFYVHPQVAADDETATDLQPTTISLPLLNKRDVRDLARLSSSARELLWYTTRVVKEIRNAWFGCETHSGARELGPKWVRALETRQKEQFGRMYTVSFNPKPIHHYWLRVARRGGTESHLGSDQPIGYRACVRFSPRLLGQ